MGSSAGRDRASSKFLAAELLFAYGQAAVETTADHNAGEDASAHLKIALRQLSAGVLAGINVRWRPRRQSIGILLFLGMGTRRLPPYI